jgi:hypothetical protein
LNYFCIMLLNVPIRFVEIGPKSNVDTPWKTGSAHACADNTQGHSDKHSIERIARSTISRICGLVVTSYYGHQLWLISMTNFRMLFRHEQQLVGWLVVVFHNNRETKLLFLLTIHPPTVQDTRSPIDYPRSPPLRSNW